MYMYIYIYMRACMYACMHICVHAYMHTCILACMHICLYAGMHIGMHICMNASQSSVSYLDTPLSHANVYFPAHRFETSWYGLRYRWGVDLTLESSWTGLVGTREAYQYVLLFRAIHNHICSEIKAKVQIGCAQLKQH